MEKLYKYIFEKTNNGEIDKKVAIQLIKQLKEKEERYFEDVAIIGVSAKLPVVNSLDEFWDNISYGADMIGKFPAKRKKDINKYLKYINYKDDEIKFNENAYIDEISNFDYSFFKLSPKEASLMDPSQRLFLEVAWHAIEDAGYGGNRLNGTETAVFTGFASNLRDMYAKIINDVDPTLLSSAMIGNLTALIPSRISYLLNLKGKSMVIDTACSSALVSVDLACNALNNKLCDYAIAGGININTFPLDKEYIRIGIESSDGRTRAFDEYSDGSGIGEGVGAILLKP